MAIKHYRQATGDYVTRMAALKQEIAERSRIGQLRDARKEGIEIGEQRGEQRGIEIGEQRGIEIGQHSNAVETARKMAARGMDEALITDLTGLKPEEWT